MRLLLPSIFVFVVLECVVLSSVNTYQIPADFDILPQRYQVRSSPSSSSSSKDKLRDILFRELLNKQQQEDEEASFENDSLLLNSEELNDINLNIQNDDLNSDEQSEEEETDVGVDLRQEETESHSSLVAGHQYVSGGAGEGKQHLAPDGSVPNKEEVKTDADLPAYCDPPNPCPVGYKGKDCDATRHFADFTAEYSKSYQEQQFCMCDDDHNECQSKQQQPSKQVDQIVGLIHSNLKPNNGANKQESLSPAVAKKSPRIRRDVSQDKLKKNRSRHVYLHGGPRLMRVAKKKTA